MHDDLGGPLAETITLQPGEEADPVHGARAELPAAVAARRRQVRHGLPGGAGGGPALPLAARHPDRAGGRLRRAAHRRRAQRVLSAARAAARSVPEPFCLFLDELPACAPDVQKAFYSLLLERRLGEFALPAGTWVVAAGNRVQDRALVRAMSSALVNRVTILQHYASTSTNGWRGRARNGVRADVRSFIHYLPDALMRPVPQEPVPFSTPRAWALFSRSLDLAEASGILNRETRRALAFGRLSPEDAAVFCALAEETIAADAAARELCRATRNSCPMVRPRAGSSSTASASTCGTSGSGRVGARAVNRFLSSLPPEHQLTVLTDLVARWGALGAEPAMLALLKKRRPGCERRGLGRCHRGARRAAALRMVTVPFPHLAGLVARPRVTRRRARADDGRVRLGTAGRQPRLRGAAERHASSCSCSRTRCCISRCVPTTARAVRSASSSTTRTTTSSTTSCAPSWASRRSPRAGSTCPARARGRPRRSCSRCAANATRVRLAHAGLGRRARCTVRGRFPGARSRAPGERRQRARTTTAATCSPRTSNARWFPERRGRRQAAIATRMRELAAKAAGAR